MKDYPNKPVRWIIDFGAGGLSDTLARFVATKLTEVWRQPVSISRGRARTARSPMTPAKGHARRLHARVSSTPFSINVSIYSSLPYDTRRDFAPILAHRDVSEHPGRDPNVPAKTVADLLPTRKEVRRPTWATVGVGSSPFLRDGALPQQAGFDGVHVPYNSSPQALTDLAGGRIEFMFVNMPTA